ncbi:DUF1236 domain-containing protein [Nitrobacter vulgaris]|uniref:DUF1236 domain-containing protein n=1 Tax=Nitrobacter vulgaris TaxID=29421 RepID=A0A1V4HV31_NITVU|nr:DUF1236 domain-containing protein [Nitrobacter vulgaris]OPH81838.1 hypothetical protein B2M20_15295 [Nitrobacter vulgaris]
MARSLIRAAAISVALILPASVMAQGVIGGMEHGAREGDRAAGPVGAVVGGAVGAVTGGVAGVLGIDQRPRFRQYVVEQHHPSFHYREPVHVGVVLPDSGLTYYEVPAEYGAPHYRYTVVNDQTVLVDPRTHSVVEIID